jgi:hypothetical protein
MPECLNARTPEASTLNTQHFNLELKPMHPINPPLTAAAKALEELSPKQHIAMESILNGMTRADAARTAGVDERTLRRWQHDPVFRTALQMARCDAWMESTSLLQSANREAVFALIETLRDDTRPHARIRAAKIIMDLTAKAVGLDAHGARLDEIERNIEIYIHHQQPCAPDPIIPGVPPRTHYGVPLGMELQEPVSEATQKPDISGHPEQAPSCSCSCSYSCSESTPPPTEPDGQEEPAPDTLQKPDISGHAAGAFPNRESGIPQSETPSPDISGHAPGAASPEQVGMGRGETLGSGPTKPPQPMGPGLPP